MTNSASRTVEFTPRNRLSKILAGAGGKTFEEHVESAELEVERVAGVLTESLDGDVQALILLCRQDETEVFGQCREIGWLALQIVEGARLANKHQLAQTAEGVWAMIEALGTRGVWHTDALRLHADALRAHSSATSIDPEGLAAIERELAQMRMAIGALARP